MSKVPPQFCLADCRIWKLPSRLKVFLSKVFIDLASRLLGLKIATNDHLGYIQQSPSRLGNGLTLMAGVRLDVSPKPENLKELNLMHPREVTFGDGLVTIADAGGALGKTAVRPLNVFLVKESFFSG